MIKLSKRLETISKFIDKEDITLDIGCDHALLDIYLSQKYSKKCYASDLRESALEMAKNNIKKYSNCEVIIKCGNGLDVIEDDMNIDTLIISGMGSISITNILKNIKRMKNIKKVIIQSNSNQEIVRKYMLKNGFYIEDEEIVLDKNIYYIVSVFKRGKKKYSRMQKEIGIINNPMYIKYINIEIKKNEVLLSFIPKKNFIRRYSIRKRNYYLKKKNSI